MGKGEVGGRTVMGLFIPENERETEKEKKGDTDALGHSLPVTT